MSNVLDFLQHKANLKIDNTTEPTDLRGTVFLTYVKSIISLINYFNTQYESVFNHSQQSIAHSSVVRSPQHMFINLPKLCEHTIHICGNVVYPTAPGAAPLDELSPFCISNEIADKFLMCCLSEYNKNVFSSYTVEPVVEIANNQIVITTRCINENKNITLICDWAVDKDNGIMRFVITVKLFVPVSDDPYSNLDHIYAIDMLTYCTSLISQYTQSQFL
jgi:hypothetical protein